MSDDPHGGEWIRVDIKGVKETRTAIRRCGKVAKKETRRRFKGLGEIIAKDAQAFARSKGLVGKGKLVKSIKAQAKEMRVAVRATARAKGTKYGYPRRFEYESSGARAFMRPALHKNKEEVIKRMRKVLEELGKEFGRK